ncbi:MAG: glycosyltransferase, partial [Myxococcales bacterium]|nr:glycosyltransferase [Myxococcales bacterium]
MRVTAVVPTLDEVTRLEACLDALVAAGVDEVVVSDGGSRDGTVELARRLGCRVVVGRSGRALQCNRGALAADGDVLWFVHADVRVPVTGAQAVRAALS